MAQLKGGTTIGGYLAIHFGNLKTSIQAIDGAGSGIDADLLDGYNTDTNTAANTIPVRNASGQLPGDITGNAATADKLKTQRTISLSGDVTGSVNFDGSGNVSISSTLANSGVTAGNYTKVTVDAKGRVTAGTTLAAADIPNLDASKVTSGTFDTARIPNLDWSKITSGKPTTLSGYGITDAVNISDIVTTAAANKILKLDSNAKLPASITGDADTVDGKHASDLAPSGYGLGTLAKRLNAGTDLNTVTNNGWYDVSGPTNGVSGLSWHSLLVVSSADSNYVTQLVFPMTDGTTETCFIRQRKSGTWNAWKKVWTENSDGSGSGLDADLLDGKHASDFATSTHNHDGVYAPTHTHSTLTVNTTGTASSVAGGTYNTSSNVTMTIFKPDQDLNTSSTPRFTRLGIGTSADTNSQLKMSAGTFLSGVANGASAVGFTFNTPSYTTAGAKLVSFTNNGSEKASIDKDGIITTYGGIRFSSDNTLSIGNSTTRAIGVYSRQFLAYNLTANTSSFLSFRNQLGATSDSANHYFTESGNCLYSGSCLYFSEGSSTNVDYIYNYDGSTFTDITINREYDAGAVSVLNTTSHYLYVGESVSWPRLYVQIGTAGAGVTLNVEYSKGSGTWGTLTVTDGTSNLTTTGWITWTAPGDWAQDAVNGQTRYWIRISTTTTPTTVPQVRGVNASVFTGYFARMYAHGYEKLRINNRGVLYSATFYPGLSGAGNSIQTTNYIVGTSTGIGINTTTPGYKFDVNGTARIQDTLLLSKAGGASAYALKFDNGVSFDFVNTSTKELVIRNIDKGLRITDVNDWDYNKWAGIKYKSSTTTLYIGGPSSAEFNNNTSPPSINVVFDGISNVGVGTTAPAEKLHVVGDLLVEGSGSTIGGANVDNASIIIGTGTNKLGLDNNEIYSSGDHLYIGTIGNYNTYIRNGTTEIIKVNYDGNVSIGTSTIDGRLNIGANGASDEIVKIKSQAKAGIEIYGDTANASGEPGGAYVEFHVDNSTTKGIIGMVQNDATDPKTEAYTGTVANALLVGTKSSSPLQIGTNATARITVTSTGNIGINTASPSTNLHVVGDIRSDGDIYLKYGERLRGYLSDGSTFKNLIYISDSDYVFVGQSDNPLRLTSSSNEFKYYDGTNSYTIWHAGNDGSGSGLDADLLDGLNSSSFLRTDADTTFSYGKKLYFAGMSGSTDTFYITRVDADTNSGDLRLYIEGDANGSEQFSIWSGAEAGGSAVKHQFLSNGNAVHSGTLTASKVYNAVYNDYAEYFEKDEEHIEPGDIVIKNIDGDGYIKSRHAFDDLVVGVVSDEFAQCIGGDGEGSENKGYVPVGLAGRLRVKIKGKCKIGDLIVASDIPGVGMAIDKKQYIPGTVVGKALENKDTEEIERVRILIMNI